MSAGGSAPGEFFSMNRTTGERTLLNDTTNAIKDYRAVTAPAFGGGRTGDLCRLLHEPQRLTQTRPRFLSAHFSCFVCLKTHS